MSKQSKWLEYELLKTPEQKAAEAKAAQKESLHKYVVSQECREMVNRFFQVLTNLFLAYWKVIAIVAAIIAVVIGIKLAGDYFGAQGEWTGKVIQTRYERNKYIQQYDPIYHENWWDTIPVLGYNQHFVESRVRSYKTQYYWTTCDVDKSYTDLSGRTKHKTVEEPCEKSKQVPVYDDWYSYYINEWHDIETVTKKDYFNKTEYILTAEWPTVHPLSKEYGTDKCGTLNPSVDRFAQVNDQMLHCQRISPISDEHYWVTYEYTSKEHHQSECELPYDKWENVRIGATAYGYYYIHNDGLDCNQAVIGIKPTSTPKGG